MSNTKRTEQTALYEHLSRDDELQEESNSIINQKQLLESYAEIHYPENNHSSKKRGIEDPYFWTPTTVGYILEKREYMYILIL